MDPEKIANHCIVVKSDASSIALHRTDEGHRLPVVHLPSPCWLPSEVAELNGALMERYGLNCTTLRWLKKMQKNSNLLLMEWHPGSQSPEIDIEWLDPLDDSVALPEEQRNMVRNWQQSSTGGLLPWEQPGWMRQVVISLIRFFDGVHHPQVTSLAQFKAAWGLSTLLFIETSDGDYFFKAGTSQGVEEYEVARFLHRAFPRYVHDPLMVDENQGWMISRRIEQTGFTKGDHASAEAVFRAYAEIQLGCDEFMSSEQAAGLPVRDESWLRIHLQRLFSEENCPEEFSPARSGLSARQLDVLRQTWERQIDQLAASQLPLTFNQEDFHFGNVLNTDKGPVFLDWADCAKSHPFFSVHRAFRLWNDDDPAASRVEKEKCASAYLDQFKHLADSAALRNEFELTRQLSLLYQAFRWQDRSRDQNRDSVWGLKCFDLAAATMVKAMGLSDTEIRRDEPESK